MADVHEPEVRSYNMSQIRGKDTKPEILVRKFLHSNGFRYRLHVNDLPGSPDLVLSKYNSVIFVHGCFWHAHNGCPYFKMPKTRTQFWKNKLYGNRQKDDQNIELLKNKGWNVIIIWECDLKRDEEEALERVIQKLK